METGAWSEHKKDRTETTWTPNHAWTETETGSRSAMEKK
jgi:hypothetical protein